MNIKKQFLVRRLGIIGVMVLILGVGWVLGLRLVSADNSPQPATHNTPRDAAGFIIHAPFSTTYKSTDLGTPNNLNVAGSVAIDPHNPDKLYFGANNFSGASGELYVITVTRNITGNITGYTGTAQLVDALAGVTSLEFMPNGTLLVGSRRSGGGAPSFIHQYTTATLAATLPISADLITVMDASQLGAFPSAGSAFARIPNGFPDAGKIKFSDQREDFFNLTATLNATATFAISTTVDAAYGSEFVSGDNITGIIFVPQNSPDFTDFGSVLLAKSGVDEQLLTYDLDASRNLITSTRRVFAHRTSNDAFYGLNLDPVTGDLLVIGSGAGSTTTLIRVTGFNPPDVTAVRVEQISVTDRSTLTAFISVIGLIFTTFIVLRPNKQ